mmetsp:Transcript_72263/g.193275  ORF Transcript_72263/g.193275 Transcript_72263/m.193275 type:complete len:81 (-) Transcript_72263:652-894(-)
MLMELILEVRGILQTLLWRMAGENADIYLLVAAKIIARKHHFAHARHDVRGGGVSRRRAGGRGGGSTHPTHLVPELSWNW